ncbi:hypothetical protein BDK51DRAFT_51150 [Blyttiomyces helicus]|uniref:Uncharacterized protein n=1 Tax=Blyttiomyces helicus TaxID=388810 RepID=A0A4P9WEY5_9FUNG|nr:hypothetical protein BDK51DRAFT_51150 [Blyttiomyces helicus]|eukprot:RKO88976.1 hypothetical protein BDK51DRAFT_51150 [Blyttiomyces helicus]
MDEEKHFLATALSTRLEELYNEYRFVHISSLGTLPAFQAAKRDGVVKGLEKFLEERPEFVVWTRAGARFGGVHAVRHHESVVDFETGKQHLITAITAHIESQLALGYKSAFVPPIGKLPAVRRARNTGVLKGKLVEFLRAQPEFRVFQRGKKFGGVWAVYVVPTPPASAATPMVRAGGLMMEAAMVGKMKEAGREGYDAVRRVGEEAARSLLQEVERGVCTAVRRVGEDDGRMLLQEQAAIDPLQLLVQVGDGEGGWVHVCFGGDAVEIAA